MIRKLLALTLVLMLALPLVACGEEETTTLTGMVTAINGTVLTIAKMDSSELSQDGNMTMPSGMEDFSGFGGGGFSSWGDGNMPSMPEGATMPDFGGGNMPQWGGGEHPTLPEGETMPDFEGGNMPSLPEGETMPDFGSGDFSGFGGSFDGTMPNMDNLTADAEKQDVDIGSAHISVEIDGGKASGSLEDIKVGSFVTITMDGDGNVTNVLVSQSSGFGGRRNKTDE